MLCSAECTSSRPGTQSGRPRKIRACSKEAQQGAGDSVNAAVKSQGSAEGSAAQAEQEHTNAVGENKVAQHMAEQASKEDAASGKEEGKEESSKGASLVQSEWKDKKVGKSQEIPHDKREILKGKVEVDHAATIISGKIVQARKGAR